MAPAPRAWGWGWDAVSEKPSRRKGDRPPASHKQTLRQNSDSPWGTHRHWLPRGPTSHLGPPHGQDLTYLPRSSPRPPLQTTTTTTMKSPHSLTSLHTRGKKEEARFLTSHGAFSRDTSSSTGGFGCHQPGGEQKLPGLWVGLSRAPPALQNQDQDPA